MQDIERNPRFANPEPVTTDGSTREQVRRSAWMSTTLKPAKAIPCVDNLKSAVLKRRIGEAPVLNARYLEISGDLKP